MPYASLNYLIESIRKMLAFRSVPARSYHHREAPTYSLSYLGELGMVSLLSSTSRFLATVVMSI
jgi:hypothetical protein